MKLKQGFIIAVEGIDGCGKSTTIKYLERILKRHHVPFTYAKETTSTYIGRVVRHWIHGYRSGKRDNPVADIDTVMDGFSPLTTEKTLFAVARRACLKSITYPALRENRVVLYDRYLLSGLAYQGVIRAIDSPDERGKATLTDRRIERPKYSDLNQTLFADDITAGAEVPLPLMNFYIYLDTPSAMYRLKHRWRIDACDRYLMNKSNYNELQSRFTRAKKYLRQFGSHTFNINGHIESRPRARIVYGYMRPILNELKK